VGRLPTHLFSIEAVLAVAIANATIPRAVSGTGRSFCYAAAMDRRPAVFAGDDWSGDAAGSGWSWTRDAHPTGDFSGISAS